ncbi:MAG: hypothetical protein JW876_08115 [Candidatus Krumholzibacteriota bacterium]|nr:hypothetical protein [Candidatus Krumholzibacteriota bacterium]
MNTRRRFAVLLACAAVALAGCGEDSAVEPRDGSLAAWPDRTEREDCIETILLAYEHRDAGRYADLLHPDFEWHLQPGDAGVFGVSSWDKSMEFQLTGRLFDLAIMLELTIQPAGWDTISTVGAVPCPGCLKTTRPYEIRAQLEANGTIHVGNDLIQVIVAPDPDEPGKWQIRYMFDLPKE